MMILMGKSVTGTCSLEECDGDHRALGWCNAHYLRFRIHGDPRGGGPLRRSRGKSDEARFWTQVVFTDHGLEWTGGKNGKYGRMILNSGSKPYAHRYAWELFRGPLGAGEIVDHASDCPKTCVTPGHFLIHASQSEHGHAGWARGEYVNNWSTRPPNPIDRATGRFVKAGP